MASAPFSPCQGRNQYQLFSLGCAGSAWDKRRPWRQGEETPKPGDLVLSEQGNEGVRNGAWLKDCEAQFSPRA